MLEHAAAIVRSIFEFAEQNVGALESARDYILQRFGQNGLYAAYVVLGVLGAVILYRLVKISLLAIKYLVVPSVVLALLASFVLPYSFSTILPITVTLCSLMLLVKA
ncbi:MAG: hypothetical protein AB1644_09575 [Candidatus Zixiibacteriota bacterium]